MVKLNENIRIKRKQLQLTQDQFAQKLGIKRSLIGSYEEGRAEPRLELLHKMATLFGITVDSLISQDFTRSTGNVSDQFSRGANVVVVTTDLESKENIDLVPQKAAAGYLNGYSDPEFITELPKFNLPMLNRGTYRAFEITGDSMLPILPGTIVVGEYLENLKNIKSGKTYVLVTQNEGVVYKRVFNYLDENKKLFLVSDNRQYAPFQIDGEEVIEVWAAKAYISVQFPDVDSKNEVSIDQLAEMILEMKKEIQQLKSTPKSD